MCNCNVLLYINYVLEDPKFGCILFKKLINNFIKDGDVMSLSRREGCDRTFERV